MKRISAFLLLLTLLFSLLCLSSCNQSDVPEDMKLARGGDDVGYKMFVPEEWTVSLVGDITSAYVSAVNRTSVSYTELPMPEGSVQAYFENSLSEFPVAPTVTVNGENALFGNAESALKYCYQYTYSGVTYGFLQIFAEFEDRFGIFTYTADLTEDDGSSKYATYLEKAQSVIDEFVYLTKSGTPAEVLYEKDADGWNLVSDKTVAKFSLYLPETMAVNFASGIVSASYSDGASITLTQTKAENTTFSDYWSARKSALTGEYLFRNLDVKMQEKEGEQVEYRVVSLGDLPYSAYAYEYTYDYNGTSYHVLQVYGASSFHGFVFTYTAAEEHYASHVEEVGTIMEKIKF